MRLTPSGERLRVRVGQILRDVDLARQEAMTDGAAPSGEISIGATPAIVALIGVSLIERIHAQAPLVRPRVLEGYSGYLQDWVLTGTIDMALVNGFQPSNPMLTHRSVAREQLVAVSAPGAPDAPVSLGEVSLSEVLDSPLILPSATNPTRGLIDAAARSLRRTVSTRLDVDSATLLKDLAAEGFGVTVLPYAAVARDVRDGRLTARRIVEPQIPCDLNLIFPRDKPPTKLAELLIHQVTELLTEVAERPGARGWIELYSKG